MGPEGSLEHLVEGQLEDMCQISFTLRGRLEWKKKDWKRGTPGTSDIMFQSYSVIVFSCFSAAQTQILR